MAARSTGSLVFKKHQVHIYRCRQNQGALILRKLGIQVLHEKIILIGK